MLTIGEFSKLGRVSARMLRHYDILGLLRPAHTGENGYRYYDETQLAQLVQITTLQGYGFKLSEIGELLALPQPQLSRRIHHRRLAVLDEIQAMRKNLRRMESHITRMEGNGMSLNKYNVIVMQCPAQRVFALRRTIHISETHQLFSELLARMEEQGLTRTGPTQQIFMGEEFDYENLDLEAQVQVADVSAGEGVKTLPAGSFVATTHTGPYEDVKYAYEAISDWMAQHPQYRATGGGIERYLKDEGMVTSPEELETGVLFPVERTGKAPGEEKE